MDTGDVLSSAIATVSLIATAILAYRQTRMHARLTAIEAARRREEGVGGLATELPVGSDDPPLFHRCSTAWTCWSRPRLRCGQDIGSRFRS